MCYNLCRSTRFTHADRLIASERIWREKGHSTHADSRLLLHFLELLVHGALALLLFFELRQLFYSLAHLLRFPLKRAHLFLLLSQFGTQSLAWRIKGKNAPNRGLIVASGIYVRS